MLSQITLPLSTLEKTDTSIVYQLPPGKPDPTQACQVGKEKRRRVLQKALKGGTCWYYAFCLLRGRIGKYPCKELLKDRAFEKLCSQRRKEQTAYDAAFPIPIAELYSSEDASWVRRLNLENAETFLKFYKSSKKPQGPDLLPYIEEFIKVKTHPNFHAFLLFKRASKIIEINTNFLEKFPKEKDLLETKEHQGLDVEQRASDLDTYVRHFSAALYKLNKSTWKPSEGIKALIRELKEKGPLMILGDFGKEYYVKPPFKMERKIFGRSIYAWRKDSERHSLLHSHTVLLVGAKKTEDNAFAYFIDPCDPSDPRNRNTQKIYMISFTNLTSHICSLSGDKQPLDDSFGWAYYGNFKI